MLKPWVASWAAVTETSLSIRSQGLCDTGFGTGYSQKRAKLELFRVVALCVAKQRSALAAGFPSEIWAGLQLQRQLEEKRRHERQL